MDNLITLLELTDMRQVIGRRLKARRELLKMSKSALAVASDVNRNAIAAIEDGESWPQYENLQTLVACLGVDIEYLFAKVEAKPIQTRSSLIGEIVLLLAGCNENELLATLTRLRLTAEGRPKGKESVSNEG